MLRTALKTAAYAKAPRATFAVTHPVKAVRLKKAAWDLRHAWAPRAAALGVAAVALPLGMALGALLARSRD